MARMRFCPSHGKGVQLRQNLCGGDSDAGSNPGLIPGAVQNRYAVQRAEQRIMTADSNIGQMLIVQYSIRLLSLDSSK